MLKMIILHLYSGQSTCAVCRALIADCPANSGSLSDLNNIKLYKEEELHFYNYIFVLI